MYLCVFVIPQDEESSFNVFSWYIVFFFVYFKNHFFQPIYKLNNNIYFVCVCCRCLLLLMFCLGEFHFLDYRWVCQTHGAYNRVRDGFS